MSLLDTVKTLLGITDDSKDAILTLYIDIVTQQILNYTNRAELPDGLIYVAAQMVVDVYGEASNSSKRSGKVISISEDGTSASFDASIAQMTAENKLEERKGQLNSFRMPYRITKRGGDNGF